MSFRACTNRHPLRLVALVILPFISSHVLAQPVNSGNGHKVAVIFNGGDQDPYMNGYFDHDMAVTIQFYKDAGFDRIEVLDLESKDPGHSPTAQDFNQIISSLKSTKELHVKFISHGFGTPQIERGSGLVDGINPSGLDMFGSDAPIQRDQAKYPLTQLTSNEKKLGEQLFDVKGGTNLSRFEVWTNAIPESEGQDTHIGLGDIENDIKNFQVSNPAATTTLYANSCFFASASRALANTPNVQVFSSARASVSGFALAPVPLDNESVDSQANHTSDYTQLLQKHLRSGETYTKAQTSAMKEYLKANHDLGSSYFDTSDLSSIALPRTSLEEFVGQWCIEHSEIKATDPDQNICRNTDLLKPIQEANEIGINFYTGGPYEYACRKQAAASDDLEASEKKMLRLAVVKMRSQIEAFTNVDLFKARQEVERTQQEAIAKKLIGAGYRPLTTPQLPFDKVKRSASATLEDFLNICFDDKPAPGKSVRCGYDKISANPFTGYEPMART